MKPYRSKESHAPTNPLEDLYETMKSGALARGRSVTVLDQLETDEFVVTFPGRRGDAAEATAPARRKKRSELRRVSIGVEWGYELHAVTLTEKCWSDIKAGLEFETSSRGCYEGTEFDIFWQFNCARQGALVVSYGEDGAEGFVGKIGDAVVTAIDTK